MTILKVQDAFNMPNRIIVFFVEDSEIFSVLLNKMLCEAAELKIYPFNSAEEALNDLYLQPDVVLMDYYLPGINGLEALKKIKQDAPNIPVILISSQRNQELSLQAMNAGAFDFIDKDVSSFSVIMNSINAIIQEKTSKMKRQYFKKITIRGILMAMLAILALGIFYYKN
jgi:FixJ family two-component response regulator